MHLHRYCVCDLPRRHWEGAPQVNINPGRSVCLGMQGLTRASQTINMDFQMHLLGFSCQTPFMPPHKGILMALSSPRKASQLQTFPIYQEIKQPGSGWAVGKPGRGSCPSSRELPPPKELPKPQPAGFVVVSAELPPLVELSCAPAQALQPSSASLLVTGCRADMRTTPSKEQIPSVSKSKVPWAAGESWQRTQTGFGFALCSLWCFTRRSQWLEMGLGDPSCCLCMLETISVWKPDQLCLCWYLWSPQSYFSAFPNTFSSSLFSLQLGPAS